jgi:hypothetical protein
VSINAIIRACCGKSSISRRRQWEPEQSRERGRETTSKNDTLPGKSEQVTSKPDGSILAVRTATRTKAPFPWRGCPHRWPHLSGWQPVARVGGRWCAREQAAHGTAPWSRARGWCFFFWAFGPALLSNVTSRCQESAEAAGRLLARSTWASLTCYC